MRAEKGSAGAVGRAIRPGEGPAGCAIRDRTSARIDHYARDAFPAALHDLNAADVYAQAIGVPLIRDDAVVGSLTVARVDPAMPFTSLELEALAVLADETQLAVSNALLHGEVADLAIHDVLTGLHNRRYFDAALPQVLMSRARMPAESRPPLSAILFDLDYFGDFNMAHGHQIGDEVTKYFWDDPPRAFTGDDLVARYGGEEFIAILPGATRDDAVRIADDVRQRLAGGPVHGVDGRRLSVTVSAGCATVDDAELSARVSSAPPTSASSWPSGPAATAWWPPEAISPLCARVKCVACGGGKALPASERAGLRSARGPDLQGQGLRTHLAYCSVASSAASHPARV